MIFRFLFIKFERGVINVGFCFIEILEVFLEREREWVSRRVFGGRRLMRGYYSSLGRRR